jgi:Fic family protein
MFLPEYTITARILKNIADIEYSKAVVDNTAILPAWERQLQKEMLTKFINATVQDMGRNYPLETIKSFVDELEYDVPQEIKNIKFAMTLTDKFSTNKELDEHTLKLLNAEICNKLIPNQRLGMFRNFKKDQKIDPEEILAQIVELFDWYNGMDAKETHPAILAAIIKASLITIHPFEMNNTATTSLAMYLILKLTGYNFRDMLCLEGYFNASIKTYEHHVSSLSGNNTDITGWIDYFTQGLATEAANVKERVKLLAKDTKLAKATGRVKVTPRQERIVEYLQDFKTKISANYFRTFQKTRFCGT